MELPPALDATAYCELRGVMGLERVSLLASVQLKSHTDESIHKRIIGLGREFAMPGKLRCPLISELPCGREGENNNGFTCGL